MRIGPKSNFKVYTLQQGEWVLSTNNVSIPEGWYIVPPSFVSEYDPLKRPNP